jgi:hypothetical protein
MKPPCQHYRINSCCWSAGGTLQLLPTTPRSLYLVVVQDPCVPAVFDFYKDVCSGGCLVPSRSRKRLFLEINESVPYTTDCVRDVASSECLACDHAVLE